MTGQTVTDRRVVLHATALEDCQVDRFGQCRLREVPGIVAGDDQRPIAVLEHEGGRVEVVAARQRVGDRLDRDAPDLQGLFVEEVDVGDPDLHQ